MRLFHQVKNIISAWSTVIKHQTELSIFFFFLTTSLFLGDGKQPFVDVWWALGILMMYGIRYYQRGKLDLATLPRPIGFAWTALILYYIILIPFSDSAGYSISATIRLIEGYLIYVLFATITSESLSHWFMKGLLFVGVVATLASFVFLLFPSLASFVPPMNLLYATYGHNHLADLLLFVFPVAIGLIEKKRNILSVGLLALLTLGMLLTFSRGAWILLVLYLLFLVWKSKSVVTRRVGLFIATATIVAFLAVSLISLRDASSGASLRSAPQNGSFTDRFIRQIQKPSLLQDGRWEYWRQAVEAIKERPLFGSGPGTFYLESKRLQARPSSYSWFAHSFPLETMVEVGVVGLAFFLFFSWGLFRTSAPVPLLWGVGLVLAYSLYEFTLNYTVMWLLVWAAIGVLTKHAVQRPGHSRVATSALIILALFYILSVGSLAASVLGYPKLAFFLAPYDANTTKRFLEEEKSGSLSDAPTHSIGFFYKADPEVLFAAIDAGGNDEFSTWAYKQALSYDPKNIDKYKAYIRFLIQQNDTTSLWDAVTRLGKLELPVPIVLRLQKITVSIEPLSVAQKEELTEPFFGTYNTNDRYSKFFYLLGLLSIDDNPKTTVELWKLTLDLAPWWTHYHLELAGLYYWKFRDAAAAADALQVCRRNMYAERYCTEKIENLALLPQPGTLKDKIVAIPR